VYNRGNRGDYDALERLGNPGWGWDDMLPVFKTIEDNELGPSEVRGAGGPLHVSTVDGTDPLLEDVITAGTELGWRRMRDLNETDEERIGYTMATIRAGQRVSAANAFLHPVMDRPNLTVALHTVIDRVVLAGGRAIGVRGRRIGQVVESRATREVILATGSIATPKILQLSGIGPADELRSAGVDVAFSMLPLEPGKALQVEQEPGMLCVAYILRPDSEGSIHLTSADPDAPLDIDANYLATEHDRTTAVSVFRDMRRLFATGSLAKRIYRETVPGPAVQADQEIIDAGLTMGGCGFHAIGTCAMGPNDDDVVDPRLRVRGVRNLRVVDASVLPIMVSGNLSGPISALAWRAADLILEDA
jgi:choline dehydrogenase-like flavoprotein